MAKLDRDELLSRFEQALDLLESNPESPLPGRNPDAFRSLLPQLERHAEIGDPQCQAALATVLAFGLACATEAEFLETQAESSRRATALWSEAAMQRFWPAFDNLVTCGVGPEGDAAREVARTLATERPDLVGSEEALPLYGPRFMQTACDRFARTRAA